MHSKSYEASDQQQLKSAEQSMAEVDESLMMIEKFPGRLTLLNLETMYLLKEWMKKWQPRLLDDGDVCAGDDMESFVKVSENTNVFTHWKRIQIE